MARTLTPLSDECQLVTVKHHQGSTIFSYEGESGHSLEKTQILVTELIDQLQEEVERQDGIVGHIKTFINDSGASILLSSTGDEIHAIQSKSRTVTLHFTAILFVNSTNEILNLMEQKFLEI